MVPPPYPETRVFQGLHNLLYIIALITGLQQFWTYRHVYPIKQRSPVVTLFLTLGYAGFFFSMTWNTVFDTWNKSNCAVFITFPAIFVISFINFIVLKGVLLLLDLALTKFTVEFDSKQKLNRMDSMIMYLLTHRHLVSRKYMLGYAFFLVSLQLGPVIIRSLVLYRSWVENPADTWCNENMSGPIVTFQSYVTIILLIILIMLSIAFNRVRENFFLATEFRMLVVSLVMGLVGVAIGRSSLEPFLYGRSVLGPWLITGPSTSLGLYASLWYPILKAKKFAKQDPRMADTDLAGSKEPNDAKEEAALELKLSGSDFSPNIFRKMKPRTMLKEFLRTPENFEDFKRFLCEEFAVENLLFWTEVRQITELPESTSLEVLQSKVRNCFNKYVGDNAVMLVNLSSETRNSLLQKIESGSIEDKAIFAEAETEILNLMAQDSFQRYKQLPSFKQWLQVKTGEIKIMSVATSQPEEQSKV
jgi:general stress protein CsbA